VIVTGDDGPDIAVQPVISQVGGDRSAGVVAKLGVSNQAAPAAVVHRSIE
jgi:hypothetical protein